MLPGDMNATPGRHLGEVSSHLTLTSIRTVC